jgi:hypothetical protein
LTPSNEVFVKPLVVIWKSKFESQLDKYGDIHSPNKYNTSFKLYKKELNKCIERGVNPIFDYPILHFEAKTQLHIKSIRPPANLSPKFKKGFRAL